jgi:hypothetical protein
MSEYIVEMNWDAEAHVWTAENDEIPLALESGSYDALIERVRYIAPEILAENGKPQEVILDFETHRRERAYT